LCRYYVPEGTIHFIRVYSGWEEEKVCRLRAHGLTVEVLSRDEEKAASGTEVRRRSELASRGSISSRRRQSRSSAMQ
jgi:hypothetical protein